MISTNSTTKKQGNKNYKAAKKALKVRTHLLHITDYELRLIQDAVNTFEAIGLVTDDDDALERNEYGEPLKWVAIDNIKEAIELLLTPEDEDF